MSRWAEGVLSSDDAFAQLFEEYGPVVLAWLRVRVDHASADDLFQEVWTIFCRRWREWQPQDTVDAADARPVLSFLFRTCHLVLMAHRRVARQREIRPLTDAMAITLDGSAHMTAKVRLGECLSAAKATCSDEEIAVLTAKLAGVSAREIARTLAITEAAVDHRFRSAIARIRERLTPAGGETR